MKRVWGAVGLGSDSDDDSIVVSPSYSSSRADTPVGDFIFVVPDGRYDTSHIEREPTPDRGIDIDFTDCLEMRLEDDPDWVRERTQNQNQNLPNGSESEFVDRPPTTSSSECAGTQQSKCVELPPSTSCSKPLGTLGPDLPDELLEALFSEAPPSPDDPPPKVHSVELLPSTTPSASAEPPGTHWSLTESFRKSVELMLNIRTIQNIRKIQKSRNPEIWKSRNPEIQKSGNPEIRKSRNPEIWKSRNPEIQKSGNPEIQIQKSGNPEIRKSRNPAIQKFS
jgi:hypothetical protein